MLSARSATRGGENMEMISSLLDPKVFMSLSDRDIEVLAAVVDSEVKRNPEIQEILRKRLDEFPIARAKKS
jgi:hypothetical protein